MDAEPRGLGEERTSALNQSHTQAQDGIHTEAASRVNTMRQAQQIDPLDAGTKHATGCPTHQVYALSPR
ncbi:hypothetical protein Moror_13145 [Moniliophthora roreri MCA 2997]|uniref:Uncharacterized protein n=1 Tax=Moniliophthora roreri (strain MCA 2997) TaxID=1381753 RepID=V2X866_MONRO|nr:hypothetical protein Moror_13145 [Moniliophthora roreri MCA 2997]